MAGFGEFGLVSPKIVVHGFEIVIELGGVFLATAMHFFNDGVVFHGSSINHAGL
jgi:hypothetical protein